MARIHTFAAAVVALTLLTACSDGNEAAQTLAPAAAAPTTATGPSQPMGEGSVWTYVLSDSTGKPTEVGVRLSAAALNGLPADTHGMHPMPTVLSFPSGTNTGVLNHVEFYWNPQGHEPPGVWDKPHFDYHFFMTDPAAAAAIVPTATDFATKAARVPDAKYVPADFVAPPGSAVDNTIPGMGLHWLDKTEPPVPGQYQFTETMINGSYDGTMTFIEPMITRDWLLTRTALDEQLKLPQAFQRSGLWPTTYTVRYDPAKDEYAVALGGFTERTAS
ncbi:MAG TPA: DUF5602 domain-containing protein [Sporichthya sp.]|nr:DUF5602 domain-containing protein [Sporichthya sp.]